MELLQFEITNAGTLGSRWTPPAPETKRPPPCPEPHWQLSCRRRTTRMIGAAMLPT